MIANTIGKTVYDDLRLMESVVRDSDLDLPHVTEYLAGEIDPIGAFTSRSDLADYLIALTAPHGRRDTVTVSTTVKTPIRQTIQREAFKSAQPPHPPKEIMP